MTIDTNIRLTDNEGRSGLFRAYAPDELLRVMKAEGIKECKVSCAMYGHKLVNASLTILDVEKWVSMNQVYTR